MTVAAVAAGAVVAAGQTMVTGTIALSADATPITGALLPVADRVPTSAPEPAITRDAIGGDQLLADSVAIGALDPEAEVDVQNLAKAVDIGQQLAQQASIINLALADGAPAAFLSGDNAFVQPMIGRLTSVFGARWGTSHQGIDIANRIGTPIYAVTDGVVEESGPVSGFGLWVVLRHRDGTQSVYGHINRAFVREGDTVRAGEQIAEVGNRGHSTGPHLHLEVWDADGRKLNPIPWLLRHGIRF